MALDSIQFASLCLLIGAFIVKINIVVCEFDPVIMMLADYFAHLLMPFLHSIIGLHIFMCFAVACTGFSFPNFVLPLGAPVWQVW